MSSVTFSESLRAKPIAEARAGAEEVKRRTFLTLLASAVSERALAQATVLSSCGSVTLSAGTPHLATSPSM